MQAWSLREPIVKAVPKDELLILDLNGGRCQQDSAYWGYPAVAGNLHNFGEESTFMVTCSCWQATSMRRR